MDLFVADGFFVDALSPVQQQSAVLVEAKGLVVAPGFVDLHCHLREPGDRHKETIATGTAAAAAGGFTTVVCASNTKPPADSAGTIQLIKDAITRDARVRVLPTGCLSLGRQGEQLAPIGTLKKAGVVAVTDSGHCLQHNELMRRAMEYARMFDLVVLDRPEDASLTEGCQMNEGEWSLRLGLRGMHAAAENVMLARDAIFCEAFRARLHVQSLSSRGGVEMLRRSKDRGVPITAEVTPHHLALTDAAVKNYDTHTKTVPPLRSEDDRQALIEGLRDGTIDCLATSHAPHTAMEKDREYDYAPFGINSLETALPVALQVLVQECDFPLSFVVDCFTRRAANVLKLNAGTMAPGVPADFILFDPAEAWVPTPETLHSRSHNTPWLGKTLRGRVKRTYVGGQLRYAGEAPQPTPVL